MAHANALATKSRSPRLNISPWMEATAAWTAAGLFVSAMGNIGAKLGRTGRPMHALFGAAASRQHGQYFAVAPVGFRFKAAVFSRALASIMPSSLATAMNWKPSAARRLADSTSGT